MPPAGAIEKGSGVSLCTIILYSTGKLSELLENIDLDKINGKQNGIDVNVKDSRGNTPLHWAICYDNGHGVTKVLTNPQVDVNVQNKFGWTPLHNACKYNRHQMISELLAIPGVDVNVRGRDGETPVMMLSARACREETFKLMLEDTRVNFDVKDEIGRGLEVLTGLLGSSETKQKRLEMINKERRKRENDKLEQEQTGEDGQVGQRCEKIDKLNKEMRDFEKKLKENMDNRKQKERDLIERQNVEKKMMAKKHKEDEATLKKKHKDEDEVERRYMAILRERRDELAHDLQKLTIDSVQDTSRDRGKIEAAERDLECPICSELMKPPTRIWMCRLSHIICEPCKEGLDKKKDNPGICPTCMTERVTRRAFLAENFARSIFNK